MPTTATLEPSVTPHVRSGEYVVMPAHSSGVVAAGSRFSGMCSANASDTTISVA